MTIRDIWAEKTEPPALDAFDDYRFKNYSNPEERIVKMGILGEYLGVDNEVIVADEKDLRNLLESNEHTMDKKVLQDALNSMLRFKQHLGIPTESNAQNTTAPRTQVNKHDCQESLARLGKPFPRNL